MGDSIRCRCQRCKVSGLTWPAVLITLGVLFLVSRGHWGYGIGALWPVLLVVIGLLKLAEAFASTEGHIGS